MIPSELSTNLEVNYIILKVTASFFIQFSASHMNKTTKFSKNFIYSLYSRSSLFSSNLESILKLKITSLFIRYRKKVIRINIRFECVRPSLWRKSGVDACTAAASHSPNLGSLDFLYSVIPSETLFTFNKTIILAIGFVTR